MEEQIDFTLQSVPDDISIEDSDDDLRTQGRGLSSNVSACEFEEKLIREEISTPRTPRIPELQLLESRLGVDQTLQQLLVNQENSSGGYYVDEESDED